MKQLKYEYPGLPALILSVHEEEQCERPLHEKLTAREFQVMCMLASGKEVKEMAEELCLNVKTVSTYRARTVQKMQMKNNTELVTYAVKNRLVE